MAVKLYYGPDPEPIRSIDIDDGAFPDDPDWSSTAVTEPVDGTWATLQFRRGNIAPLTKLLIKFAFFTAADIQVVGGTCNYRVFTFDPREAYGMKPEGRMIYHLVGDGTAATYPMEVPLVVDVTKHAKMGIQLTNITHPANTVRLAIAIQELR